MFKFLVCICLTLMVFCEAKNIDKPIEKPAGQAKQERCYVKELNTVLPFNKTYTPPDGRICAQYMCNKNETISVKKCEVIELTKGWEKFEGVKTEPYPACCDFALFTGDD
ncbi:uncharacterized protein LOC131855636 isoform X2 [Achroia grisella]|uniref:uncharacterized protein LOC131855636 isoform X2 n=1 Tax=Achroia grisella TaxID=688607 RepID=UPI0027D2C3DD|nr:uncharacterized protein LOC131855636 isoform X2 [Achroia grisella]